MRNKVIFLILSFYLLFLMLDLTGNPAFDNYSIALKYSSIILCFLITLLKGNKVLDITDTRLLQAALFTTLFADLFLLVLNHALYGVILFCIVQTIYIARHSRASALSVRATLAAAAIFSTVLYSWHIMDSLIILSLLYGCLSLISIYIAATLFRYKKYPEKTKLFVISGLTLLFLCDLNVAYYNIFGTFASGYLMWLFYLPSQLLLSLSGDKYPLFPPQQRSQLRQQWDE